MVVYPTKKVLASLLGLILVMVIGVGPITPTAKAFELPDVNLMSIFDDPLDLAKKKTEKAIEEAELAEKEAAVAQAKAEAARKKAERFQQDLKDYQARIQTNDQKIAKTDTKKEPKSDTRSDTKAKATQPKETNPTEDTAHADKRSKWNPMNWLPGPDESEAENPTTPADSRTAAELNTADSLTAESEATTTEHHEDAQPTPDKAATAINANTGVLLETQKGNIVIELFPDEAPITVANFVKLVNTGFYNQPMMKFHRVVPGFVAQTGDPTGTGAGGSKDRIPLEVKNKLSHNVKGIVSMARSAAPDTATSQFYITLAPQKNLDGKYAIFGQVVNGLDILDKIEKNDLVYGAKLVNLADYPRDNANEKSSKLTQWFK